MQIISVKTPQLAESQLAARSQSATRRGGRIGRQLCNIPARVLWHGALVAVHRVMRGDSRLLGLRNRQVLRRSQADEWQAAWALLANLLEVHQPNAVAAHLHGCLRTGVGQVPHALQWRLHISRLGAQSRPPHDGRLRLLRPHLRHLLPQNQNFRLLSGGELPPNPHGP